MSIVGYGPYLLLYCIFVAALIGAAAGSFLNCAAWRIVHGESFIRGRSHCPACGHTLGPAELIPILSWILLRGRCKWCGEKISVRYPLTELIFSALTVLCVLRFGLSVLCLRNFLFLCCLFLLSLTDLENMTIPGGCLLTAALVWAAALPFLFSGWNDVLASLLAAAVFSGGLLGISLVMNRLLDRKTLGSGDVLLFAVIGLYLGLIGSLFAVILACAAALALRGLLRRLSGRREFAFGPSAAIAAAALLLFGEPLIRWYQGLL